MEAEAEAVEAAGKSTASTSLVLTVSMRVLNFALNRCHGWTDGETDPPIAPQTASDSIQNIPVTEKSREMSFLHRCDGRTDRRTDGWTNPLIEMRGRI